MDTVEKKREKNIGNQIENLVIAYHEESNTRWSSLPTTQRAAYSQSASRLGSCNEGAPPLGTGASHLEYCSVFKLAMLYEEYEAEEQTTR